MAVPDSGPAEAQPLGVHVEKTLRLAAPIIVARAGLVVLISVDSIMAGHAGQLDLAAFGLGVAPLMTLMLVCLGALQATVVLAAQAIGRGEPHTVGEVLRAGLVNALVLGCLAGGLALAAEPFFLATGQQPEVAAAGARVAEVFALGLPGLLLFITVNLILEATGRARTGMVLMLIANVLNVLADGVLVLGWGGLVAEGGGAVTATATSTVLRWGLFAAAIAILLRDSRRDGDRYRMLADAGQWWRTAVTLGGEPGRVIRRMGLPMGLAQGVESAAFSTMVFFAGLLGTAALAAHQTTMTVMSLVYMNAVGLAGATSIRVGNAVGRRGAVDMARAGWSGIGLGGLLSGLCGLAMILQPEAIARFVVSDPAAVAVATETLRFAGLFTAFDAMMGVAMGALRGVGDVWVPLGLQSAAFWIAAVPTGWLFGFHLDYGAVGLFAGIGAGITASLALLLPRFHLASRRLAGSFGQARSASSP
nr:MATE family efflux transporter [Chthonobacter rhizosphaerae]